MSSAGEDKYPRRVIPGGNVLIVNRSIHHNCALSKIANMREFIGPDAYDDIKNHSQVGVILKLADSEFSFRSRYVQHLLANMLETSMPHELWVLADGRPIRFSLHEFQRITGMECGLDDGKDDEVAELDLSGELGLINAKGPMWADLQELLKKCTPWSLAKRKMVGLLVVLHVGIFGLRPRSRIPISRAKLVTVPERFEGHPWGRLAFRALVGSIPSPSLHSPAMSVRGMAQVLLIWAFEHIPHLAFMCGTKRIGEVPLLRWTGQIARNVDLEDVFSADKKKSPDKKVRVVHLVEKPSDEIYPEWPGEEYVDPKVDRMIKDIVGGKLDETFWDVPSNTKRASKRKAAEKHHHPGNSNKSEEKEAEKKKHRVMLRLEELNAQYTSDILELQTVVGKHAKAFNEFIASYSRVGEVGCEIAECHKRILETAKKMGEEVEMWKENVSTRGEAC